MPLASLTSAPWVLGSNLNRIARTLEQLALRWSTLGRFYVSFAVETSSKAYSFAVAWSCMRSPPLNMKLL